MKKQVLSPRLKRILFNLCIAGQQLSNIAYNWKQQDDRPEHDRKVLKECQQQWDAASAKLPKWMTKP